MTVPVGIATFFFFPNTPYRGKPWFLTDEEHAIAVQRVQAIGIAPPAKITLRTFTRILSRWRWYAFVFGYVVGSLHPVQDILLTCPSALWLLIHVRRLLWHLAQI